MSDSIYISPDEILTRYTRQAVDDIQNAVSLMKKVCANIQTASTVPCGESWYVFNKSEQSTALSCLSRLQDIAEKYEKVCTIAEYAPHDFMETDRSYKGKLTGSEFERAYRESSLGKYFSSSEGKANLIASLFFPAVGLIPGSSDFVTQIYKKAEISYETKGGVYKAAQYGKCVEKFAGGVLKGFKAFGELVVLDPRGLLTALSAADAIGTSFSNGIYVHYEMYDEIEDNSALKTTLSLGCTELVGNEEDGAILAEGIYSIYELADLCNGASDMIDSIGDAHVALTGKAGYSRIFGETSFDYLDNEYRLSTNPDYFIRKALDIDPSSTVNVIYEAGKNIQSTIKDAKGLGEDLAEYITDIIQPRYGAIQN